MRTVYSTFLETILLTLRPEGLPEGVVGYLDPDFFNPTPRVMSLTSTLHVSTNSSAIPGEYTIHLVGTSAGLAHQGDTKLVIMYSDIFKQTGQIISSLSDYVKGAIIGAVALTIATMLRVWRRGNKGKPESTSNRKGKKVERTLEPPTLI